MKTVKFLVRIEETLSRCVEVEMKPRRKSGMSLERVSNAALAKVQKMYNSGEVVLGADDFVGVDFSIVGVDEWEGVGR